MSEPDDADVIEQSPRQFSFPSIVGLPALFLDFGNRAVQIGSGPIPPRLITGKSWAQLAAALRQPKTALGAALLNEADSITAELCRLTGDRPAAACPAFLRNAKLPS